MPTEEVKKSYIEGVAIDFTYPEHTATINFPFTDFQYHEQPGYEYPLLPSQKAFVTLHQSRNGDYYVFNFFINGTRGSEQPTLNGPYYYSEFKSHYVLADTQIDMLGFLKFLKNKDGENYPEIGMMFQYTAYTYYQFTINIPTRLFSLSLFSDNPSDVEPEVIDLQSKSITITSNHDAVNPLIIEPDEGYDAMSSVIATVEVPQHRREIGKSVTILQNGTTNIAPDTGYDCLESVRVITNVPTSANIQASKEVDIAENGTTIITPNSGYDAIGEISVNTNVKMRLTNIKYNASGGELFTSSLIDGNNYNYCSTATTVVVNPQQYLIRIRPSITSDGYINWVVTTFYYPSNGPAYMNVDLEVGDYYIKSSSQTATTGTIYAVYYSGDPSLSGTSIYYKSATGSTTGGFTSDAVFNSKIFLNIVAG